MVRPGDVGLPLSGPLAMLEARAWIRRGCLQGSKELGITLFPAGFFFFPFFLKKKSKVVNSNNLIAQVSEIA